MTHPRQSLVDLSLTPYCHLVGRCVRRAFLCGVDAYNQRDCSHRKAWVVDLLAQLAVRWSEREAASQTGRKLYRGVLFGPALHQATQVTA